jgi:hypothetical protein
MRCGTRRNPSRWRGISARRLGAAHQIVHLCIHAGGQHLFSMGLKPLCDVAEAITAYGDRLNWDEVVQAARAWGCARHVYLVLQLVAALLRDPPTGRVCWTGSTAAAWCVDRFLTYAITQYSGVTAQSQAPRGSAGGTRLAL